MSSDQPIHGTGLIVNTEVAGKNFKVYEPVTARIQHLRLEDINYINVYLPTVNTRVEGRERWEAALGDLSVMLEPLRGEPIAIAGDFNYSSSHKPGRKNALTDLLEKHNLKLCTPEAPTNYPHGNGAPAALDHLAVSAHFCEVEVEVLDRSKVPVNNSTHLPLVWTFTIEEKVVEREEEEETNDKKTEITKLPRPDWRYKTDLDLYQQFEPIYVQVAMDTTTDLPAAWRAKTVSFVLSKVSAISRMVPRDQEEVNSSRRKWYSNQIRDLTRKLSRKRGAITGEFYFVTTAELLEMFPGDQRIVDIKNMETRMSALRADLNVELNRILSEEAEEDNAQLLITMRGGDSKAFYNNSKVKKIILSETPKEIHHNGIIYSGDDILKCFTIAALEQSGDIGEEPDIPTEEYLLKKRMVMMTKNCVEDDDTYFIPLTLDKYKQVLSRLPSGKAPDIYGITAEHFKYASDKTNINVMELINIILSDIRQFSDDFISLSEATYIHKGKSRILS